MVRWLVDFFDQALQRWETRLQERARRKRRNDPDYDPFLDYP